MQDLLYHATQNICGESPWLLPLCFALFGACIGSFLNVVIYRLPLGMSVNEPRRSFCPSCGNAIPWYLNIPIISWLVLRGRSACCGKRISVRYWLVEAACMLLFAATAWMFDDTDVLTIAGLCVWGAAMLAIFCTDWEKMVVPAELTGVAVGGGLLAAVLSPWIVEPTALDTADGLLWSLVGAGAGFVLLKAVALLGRGLFGRKKEVYSSPRPWSLQQNGDEPELRMGEDTYTWSELFMEDSNRLLLNVEESPQFPEAVGLWVFCTDAVVLPNGQRVELEQVEKLSGTCTGMETRREAMGSGDALIAMGIGAICGWQGVLVSLVCGSFIGIAAGIVCRVGRGQPMPFGPAFITGAFFWLFKGQYLFLQYLDYCNR